MMQAPATQQSNMPLRAAVEPVGPLHDSVPLDPHPSHRYPELPDQRRQPRRDQQKPRHQPEEGEAGQVVDDYA